MNKTWIAVISAVLVTSAACGASRRNANDIDDRPPMSSAAAAIGQFTFSSLLTPVLPPITANVRIVAGIRPNDARAVINIAGSDPGRQHPWHIHPGSCQAREQSPLGSGAAYRMLDVAADGKATVNQSIAVNLDPVRSYYVDIHLSAMQPEKLIACGNLTRG